MKEIIVNYYNAFNSGDRSTMLSLLSENIIHEVNQGTPQIGKDVFTQFMKHMDECYIEKLIDLVIFYDEKTKKAAAEFIVDGKYIKTDGSLPRANGQTYKIRAGAFLELDNDNKISRVTTYYNLPAWIELVK